MAPAPEDFKSVSIEKRHIKPWIVKHLSHIPKANTQVSASINHEGVLYIGDAVSISTQAARMYCYANGQWNDLYKDSAAELHDIMLRYGYWDQLSKRISQTGGTSFTTNLSRREYAIPAATSNEPEQLNS